MSRCPPFTAWGEGGGYKYARFLGLKNRIGPTLLGSKVRLFTNYPIKGDFFRKERKIFKMAAFKTVI